MYANAMRDYKGRGYLVFSYLVNMELSQMKRFLIGLIILAASGVALAEPAKDRGAYIGGGLAGTTFDDGGAFAGFNLDDSDSGFSVFGGYKFLEYFAVEGRYSDFGTFRLEGIGVDVTAVSVHAVGIVPFGNSGWELFGQLGLGTATFEVDTSEDENVGSAGLGVRFSWSSNFAVAAQLDAYAYEDTSLGASYDFGVTATTLSFQYIF